MTGMRVRRSAAEDIGAIESIYRYAREQMIKNGNETQWADGYPQRSLIENDIKSGNGYIIENEGKPAGVFAFILGEDPSYINIYEGKWLNDEPYGAVHRVAAAEGEKGILGVCLDFCESKIADIRIDTHADNKIMQHLLEKRGYIKCGTVYVDDGSARIAYQKSKDR